MGNLPISKHHQLRLREQELTQNEVRRWQSAQWCPWSSVCGEVQVLNGQPVKGLGPLGSHRKIYWLHSHGETKIRNLNLWTPLDLCPKSVHLRLWCLPPKQQHRLSIWNGPAWTSLFSLNWGSRRRGVENILVETGDVLIVMKRPARNPLTGASGWIDLPWLTVTANSPKGSLLFVCCLSPVGSKASTLSLHCTRGWTLAAHRSPMRMQETRKCGPEHEAGWCVGQVWELMPSQFQLSSSYAVIAVERISRNRVFPWFSDWGWYNLYNGT